MDLFIDFTKGCWKPVNDTFLGDFSIYNLKIVTATKGIIGYPIIESTVVRPDQYTIKSILVK